MERFVTRSRATEILQVLRDRTLETKGSTTVEPGAGIRNRVVAESLFAEEDRPEYDRAMMDGYAVAAAASPPLDVIDDVFPEDDRPRVPRDAAVRITTGAPLPDTADAVIRAEDAVVEDGQLHGPAVEAGEYTYRHGSNVKAGERVYGVGDRLAARDAILLTDLGIDAVPVVRRFSVAVLATGTEISEDPSMDRDSEMLLELFDAWGADAAFEGVVADDPTAVESTISNLAADYDVVATTGGTSRGTKDYVLSALDALGDVQFHGLQFRPGKSLGVAELDDAVAFAIPGKPFAAYTVTAFVLRTFFTGSARLPTVQGTCPVDVGIPDPEYTYAIPATVDGDRVVPLGHESSPVPIYGNVFKTTALSSVTRIARADGAILAREPIVAGEQVTVVPYESLE